MRALLINPKQRTITEIDYDGTPEAMCKLIGCDIFKVASTQNGSKKAPIQFGLAATSLTSTQASGFKSASEPTGHPIQSPARAWSSVETAS